MARTWLRRALWLSLVVVPATAIVLAAPRAARAYVIQQAALRGVSFEPAKVSLGWLSMSIESADIRLDGVDDVTAHFRSIQVELDSHFHPLNVTAVGGRIAVTHGDAVPGELAHWREAHPAGGPANPNRPAPRIRVAIEEAVADAAEGRHVEAKDLEIVRDPEGTHIRVGFLDARSGMLAVQSTDARVTLDLAAGGFREARLGTADVVWIGQPRLAELNTPPPDAPLPPEAPTVAQKGHKKVVAPPVPLTPLPPLLPNLHELRERIGTGIAAGLVNFHEGNRVTIDALSVRLKQGEEELTLGTGAFNVTRDSLGVKLSFTTSPLGGKGTPLSLHADLPTGPGDVELSVSGGPVPLGLLGMHDGGLLHLLDVEKTSLAGKGRIVLDAEGRTLTFDVEGAVRDLSLKEPRLAHDPVRGMDLGFSTRGLIDDKGELRLDGAELSVGSAKASVHGGMAQTPDYLAATFDFDFPTSSCQSLLSSVPSALVPTVATARMDGTFSLSGHLAVDSRNLDAIAFNYDVNDRCRLVDVPNELDRARFSRGFTHIIYTKTGEREEEITGPGTANWTELDQISPYMQVAVLTTEDGAFFHHHGFNHSAIRRAVAANIRAHRFVRGASTITMQLAKNLFLSREKTLARKVEELVLADYLEQAFSKDEMMELYLNIIEFGPNIYGVTAAAEHYFGRKPNELNLAECMFLSSILPNPIAFHKVYDDGQLGPGWMRTIQAHMQVASRTGLISAAELTEGLGEAVVFHKANSAPPVPRTPVSTPSHPAGSSDWEELN